MHVTTVHERTVAVHIYPRLNVLLAMHTGALLWRERNTQSKRLVAGAFAAYHGMVVLGASLRVWAGEQRQPDGEVHPHMHEV